MNILENITNLRKVIPIYECDGMFLYEIIEDYKDAASPEEKEAVFTSFCSSIWSSHNKRRTCTKSIRFHVPKNLQNTSLGQVFLTWSEIEYTHYKSMTKNDDWQSIIRQKLNNIYTRYFDKEVILNKEYMDLLKTPKKLYYQWISGIDMDADTVTELIDDAIACSEKVKAKLQAEKMSLSWMEYKKVAEDFLKRCLDHCRLIEEYEDQSQLLTRLDFLTEDHFYIGYICKSLEGSIKDYQKKYYGLKCSSRKGYIRCRQCGALIVKTGNKRMYCGTCASARKKESDQKSGKTYKEKRQENRKSMFCQENQ